MIPILQAKKFHDVQVWQREVTNPGIVTLGPGAHNPKLALCTGSEFWSFFHGASKEIRVYFLVRSKQPDNNLVAI